MFLDWVLKTEQSLGGESLSYLDMMERNIQVIVIIGIVVIAVIAIAIVSIIIVTISIIGIIILDMLEQNIPAIIIIISYQLINILINSDQEENRRARERQIMEEGKIFIIFKIFLFCRVIGMDYCEEE